MNNSQANLASAGVSSAGGLLSMGIGALIARRQYKRQLQGQKDLMDYQAQVNDKYTRQLAEDSASLDVLARRKAGLNPYAGEGEMSSGIVSGSMPSAPDMNKVDVPNIGMLGIQGAIASAQIANMRANTEKTETETNWMNPLNEAAIANIDAAISLAQSQEKLNHSSVELNDANKESIIENLNMAKEQFPAILEHLNLSNSELQEKINKIQQDIKIDLEMLPANLKLSAAQAYAAYAQGRASNATARYTLESISLIQPQLLALQRENKIGDATMNLEIAGASIAYQREYQGLKSDQLDNKAKALQNELIKSEMNWSDKTGLQKADYVFSKVGQVVEIAKNVALGVGAVLHGANQYSQYQERKINNYNKKNRIYTDEIKYGWR